MHWMLVMSAGGLVLLVAIWLKFKRLRARKVELEARIEDLLTISDSLNWTEGTASAQDNNAACVHKRHRSAHGVAGGRSLVAAAFDFVHRHNQLIFEPVIVECELSLAHELQDLRAEAIALGVSGRRATALSPAKSQLWHLFWGLCRHLPHN